MVYLGPDYSLAKRLADIEDQLARMRANPLGQAFSVTQSDGSVGIQITQDPTTGGISFIIRQGPTTARDPNTAQHPVLAYFGELFSGGASEDSGVLLYRPDGTQSGVIGNRGWQIFDTKGNRVFGTDEYGSSPSGEGLRNPLIPLPPPVVTGTGSWPKTNSTSGGTVATCSFIAQHPSVWWVAQAICDAGTTGTVYAQVTNGTTTINGPSHTVGSSFITTNDVLTLPAGFYGAGWSFNVVAQVTGGTGYIYAQTFELYGLSAS